MAICYPLSAGNWLQNEWPWMTLNGYLTSKSVFSQHSVAEQMRLLEPTAQIWMKIDPYYQRQKCRPMTLVSGKIRFIKHSSNIPLGGVVKRYWGLSTTAIFGDLGGYVFENFRDTASNIIWRYAAPCRLVTDCKMNDLEWPWVAISCQNPFSASNSWIRAFDCQKIIQPQRFRGVLCIAWSVSQPR